MGMKATDLNQAMNYVEDGYLLELDTTKKEILTMKNRKKTLRILMAAALIALMAVTAVAAEGLDLFSLESGRSKTYRSYAEVAKAITESGMEDLHIPQTLDGGFRFQSVQVQDINGRDAQGSHVLTYRQLDAAYRSDAGQQLYLSIYPALESLGEHEGNPTAVRSLGDVTMRYYLDHYRLVPGDYTLTEADKQWQSQPGNFISYGSDKVEQQDVAFLCWNQGGVQYTLMDMGAALRQDTLFAIAQEMLAG